MAKLQVRLLVLIALGTISRCEDAGGPPSDSVAVVISPSGTPLLRCGPPKTVNIRFNDVKVKGPNSDVAYRRVTVTDFQLQFAMNTSVSLPSDSFLECAKATAGAGLEAFSFNGSCTGYQLTAHFLKCQTGDVALYVRADYLDEEPVVAPIGEAPYKVFENGDLAPYRVYMLSDFIEAADDHPSIEKTEDEVTSDFRDNLVFRENGDNVKTIYFVLDFSACLNNGAYGLKVIVSYILYITPYKVMYFFEECGKTVQVGKDLVIGGQLAVFSHPGFGCKDYPSGLPDQCTVRFESEDSKLITSNFGFYFYESDPDDTGLIMQVSSKDPGLENSSSVPMYSKNSYTSIYQQSWFEVSLQSQPSKPAIGFFINLFF